MPITFGSVGDIISVSLLIKDLLMALDDSRGSSNNYRTIVRELCTLDSALLHVERLSRTHNSTPELHALCQTARQTVEKCRSCVDNFKQKIQRYKRSMAIGGSSNIIKDVGRKIQWSVSEKDHVASFRAEVTGYTESINMLIATASVTLLDVTHDKLNNRIAVTERKTEASQQLALEEIRRRLDENNQLITGGNSMLDKVAERLEWVKQLGLELKNLICGVFAGNLRIYKEVVAVRKMLAGHISRSLAEDPFILEDAVGRIAPVHLRFITSWDAFEAVLEIRFNNTLGSAKVYNKEYILQEHATGREINRTTEWNLAFLPGQKIDMTMVFKENDSKNAKDAQSASCPYCLAISDKPTNANIECHSCHRWYHRVLEEYEGENLSSKPLPNPWKTQAVFGKAAFPSVVFGPSPPRKRKINHADTETDDLDIMPFKRIRLINRRKRAKMFDFSPTEPKKPIASGLLVVLLLLGAFIASESSGYSAPCIPRMPDDVRAASAMVLENVCKDTGVAPPSTQEEATQLISTMASQCNSLEITAIEQKEPTASGLFVMLLLVGAFTASKSSGSTTPPILRMPDEVRVASAQVLDSIYKWSDGDLSPGSQPAIHLRNLFEMYRPLRMESIGKTAAEVYIRSLLCDGIPSEIVHEFKRMVEESHRVRGVYNME